MKSPMLPAEHQAAVRRVLTLGRSGSPDVLPESIAMLALPSNEVQRLAASAIGKLAEFGADADAAVAAGRGRTSNSEQGTLNSEGEGWLNGAGTRV